VADHQAAIEAGVTALQQTLPPDGAARLAVYIALLTRWNRAYNLSAVREPAAMVSRHILDSLAIRPWVQGVRLLDLGSGAGLPGLVLAVAEPQWAVTLLDSNSKKTRFLRQAVIELGLDNVQVVQARAGDWRANEPFTSITARAFSELATVWVHAAPNLAPEGRLLAMTAHSQQEALAAVAKAGLSCREIQLDVPGAAGDRRLIVLMDS